MKTPRGVKGKVLKTIREQGYIDNYDVVNGKFGYRSLRLGAIIHQLKEEGYINIDEQKSGYLPDTKNWRYYITNQPKVEIYRVNGVEVGRKVVW